MFILHLLLLTLGTMIFSNPGVERVFIHAQITGCLGNGLIRLDGQFHRAFLKFRGIYFCRGLTHHTPLVCCVVSVSPCVRKSIATSDLESAPRTSVTAFLLLGVALFTALGFEFVNGFHDTANAVATVIYTHALEPHVAVVWSGFWNFLGVLLSSGAVALGIFSFFPG